MDVRHSRFNVAYCLDQFNALKDIVRIFLIMYHNAYICKTMTS